MKKVKKINNLYLNPVNYKLFIVNQTVMSLSFLMDCFNVID